MASRENYFNGVRPVLDGRGLPLCWPLVFNTNWGRPQTTGANVAPDLYTHVNSAPTGTNSADVIIQAVPAGAKLLYLYALLAANAAVTALGTAPLFQIVGRLGKTPSVSGGATGKIPRDYDSDMQDFESLGMWAPLGSPPETSLTAPTTGWTIGSAAFTASSPASITSYMKNGSWHQYLMGIGNASNNNQCRPFDVRNVSEVAVFCTTAGVFTAGGASDSAAMVVGTFA